MPNHRESDNLEGQPLSAAGEGHTGESTQQDLGECGDPKNPASKPQGSQRDQEKNMESEGQPVQLPADAGELPATPDDEAERRHKVTPARDGAGR
jgi:hypothetical protein